MVTILPDGKIKGEVMEHWRSMCGSAPVFKVEVTDAPEGYRPYCLGCGHQCAVEFGEPTLPAREDYQQYLSPSV